MPRAATGLNTATRKLPDGTVETTWYLRSTGVLIGRSRDGWTKEAAVARAAELQDPRERAGPPAGSFGELCALYLASPAFKKLAPKTQKGYRAHIDMMRGMWLTVPVAGVSRKATVALHQMFEDRPWQGNAVIRTLRLLMNFGLYSVEMPGLTKNPAQRTALYVTAPRTQVWDQPRIDAFLEAAPSNLRLAFALLLYTVQRSGDVLSMTLPSLSQRNGRVWIRLRQEKTDALVDVPCHDRLLEELSRAGLGPGRTSAEDLARSPRLVVSPTGKPWLYRNFARAWDRTKRRANWGIARAAIRAMGGLPGRSKPKARTEAKIAVRGAMLHDLQRRDLRRTGVVQLALAGATVPQIAALAGWKIDYAQKIVDTYLPRRSDVALGGMERWEASESKLVTLATKRSKAE